MTLVWPPRSGRVLAPHPRRLGLLVVALVVGYLAGHVTCAAPASGVEPALYDAVERAETCVLALEDAERDRLEALAALQAYRDRVDGSVVRTLAILADNPWLCNRRGALRLPRAVIPAPELATATDSL